MHAFLKNPLKLKGCFYQSNPFPIFGGYFASNELNVAARLSAMSFKSLQKGCLLSTDCGCDFRFAPSSRTLTALPNLPESRQDSMAASFLPHASISVAYTSWHAD